MSNSYAQATVNTVTNETSDQRRYLHRRLLSAYIKHDKKLQEKFFILNDKMPDTIQDLIDRIAAGKYIINNNEQKLSEISIQDVFYGMAAITWRDPKKPADKEGYEAAAAELEKVYEAAKDSIEILDVKTGLETLRSFEAQTF